MLHDDASKPETVKPNAIVWATVLLWASLLIGIAKTVVDWPYLLSRASASFNLAVVIVTFAVLSFFVWKIGQGKNWARITFLVLFLLGTVPFILIVRAEFARSIFSATISAVQSAIQTVALFFIFTYPGKTWFQRKGA